MFSLDLLTAHSLGPLLDCCAAAYSISLASQQKINISQRRRAQPEEGAARPHSGDYTASMRGEGSPWAQFFFRGAEIFGGRPLIRPDSVARNRPRWGREISPRPGPTDQPTDRPTDRPIDRPIDPGTSVIVVSPVARSHDIFGFARPGVLPGGAVLVTVRGHRASGAAGL